MSEALDPRIGVRNPDGRRTFPKLTLSGQTCPQPLPSTTGLDDDGKHFVVLDVFPPKDFDVDAELAALRVTVAPVDAAESADTATVTPSGRKAKEQASDAVKPE